MYKVIDTSKTVYGWGEKINCKYPNLRQAIIDRKEFYVEVTPETSREVQEIAFSCGVQWVNNTNSRIHECRFSHKITFKTYKGVYLMCKDTPKSNQFHLETDSFNPPLPEWCKVGAMAFTNVGKYSAVKIIGIVGNSVKIEFNNKCTCMAELSALSPAVLVPWTFDTAPEWFEDDNNLRWDKAHAFYGWGFYCYEIRLWMDFMDTLKNKKQSSGEPCGTYIRGKK